MKDKEDIFKGKKFQLTGPIGEGKIPYPGLILQSYGNVCLVEEKPAYTSGPFRQYSIGRVVKGNEGTEHLNPLVVDYETNPKLPPRYGAPKNEVFEMFERIVSKMRLRDSEDELKKDRAIKETLAKEAADNLKRGKFLFVKNRLLEIDQELKKLLDGSDIKNMSSDKNVLTLVSESGVLEKMKSILKMR